MFHDPENSDAGMWKTLGGPVAVVIGGDNLPSPIRIGLTDLPNIGGASGPLGPPGSGITETYSENIIIFFKYPNIFQLTKKREIKLGSCFQIFVTFSEYMNNMSC